MKTQPLPTAEVQTWPFQAGPLRLWVSTPDGSTEFPPCAAEAAVVLDSVGELLDALPGAGLAGPDDWHWTAGDTLGAAGSGADQAQAQAEWRCGTHTARLQWPWPRLRALAQRPSVPGLQWQPVRAELRWAEWQLSPEELAQLEVGGLLVLPEGAGPRPRAQDEVNPQAEGPLELVARWPEPVAVEQLLGWEAGLPPAPAECLLVARARPELALARGRLLPWGDGRALLIEAM